MSNLDSFTHQLNAMYSRLEKLYATAVQVPNAPDHHHIMPLALKELGVAAEELHVANEELQMQSERASLKLDEAIARSRYYENLFRYGLEACLVTNHEGKVLEATLSAAQLLNISLDNLIGKLLTDFVPIHYRNTFRIQLSSLDNSLNSSNLNSLNNSNLNESNNVPHSWSCYIQPRNCDMAEIKITTFYLPATHFDTRKIYWVLKDVSSAVSTKVEPYHEEVASRENVDSRPIFLYRRREIIPLNLQTLWQVKEGIVKLSSFTVDYEEVLLGLVSASAPFGIGSMFLPAYQATAVTDVKLVRFSFNEINSSPMLAQSLVSQLYQRLQQTEVLLNIAGQRRVKERLCFLLQFLRREIGEPTADGTRLQVRLIHEDIASACCSTRVTITRILSDLQKQGKIEIDRHFHIVLKNGF